MCNAQVKTDNTGAVLTAETDTAGLAVLISVFVRTASSFVVPGLAVQTSGLTRFRTARAITATPRHALGVSCPRVDLSRYRFRTSARREVGFCAHLQL